MFSLVSLAPRVPSMEVQHRELQTGVPRVAWLAMPTPQLWSLCRDTADNSAIQDGSSTVPCAETLHLARQLSGPCAEDGSGGPCAETLAPPLQAGAPVSHTATPDQEELCPLPAEKTSVQQPCFWPVAEDFSGERVL